ncbi:MAG: FMN-binding glutamate synthase family protein, partial [Deltaproteobacteria bacterium]|nr:FMN-binding glutamate synthase family protein [Deltaproteobacteria bacterium]
MPESHRAAHLAQAARDRHVHHLRNGLQMLSSPGYRTPDAVGNLRWTEDLLLSTWEQAATGRPPLSGREYRTGRSGGGFDRMRFIFEPEARAAHGSGKLITGDIDLSIPLNRRGSGVELTIPIPIYGAGFSFGSVSLRVMQARAIAAEELGTYTSTGEGGYPPPLATHKSSIITQVATGLFGVREETIQWAPIVELKYAQGAKPGLGGHLLGNKVTSDVASMRESVPWVSLFSPFPIHSVYSVEDHRKHVDWRRPVNPRALISVKVSTPVDVDMVAVGIYHAGANIIHLDGSYGGTGAAPEIAKK